MASKVEIKLQNKLIPILFSLVTFLYLLETYRGWFALSLGIGLAWLISWLWANSLAKGLSLIREMRFGWAQVGDRIEERFTLVNMGWAPGIWVKIEYKSTMPEYSPQRVTGVGSNGQVSWRKGGLCSRRGVFELGPVMLEASDPFGIYIVRILDPVIMSMFVAPPVIPLPDIEIAPGGQTGDGKIKPFSWEKTVNSYSVRKYLPGDSLRQIHWPTSIRKHINKEEYLTFYIRLFESMPSGDWWIFLDLDSEAQYGNADNNTLEHGIILAASLADHGLKFGNAVGLVTNGEPLCWLPPMKGEIRRQEILRSLALAQPGKMTLSTLLHQARSIFKERPSLIIITSNQNPSWAESMLPLFSSGGTPTIMFFDPSTYSNSSVVLNKNLLDLLSNLGVKSYTISSEIFDRPEAKPGSQGVWDWQETLSSRAILKREIGDLTWRRLN